MPFSHGYFKQDVKRWILKNITRATRVLDVGPGCGTYSKLIRQYGYQIDCIEIWEPYIAEYSLKDQYDNVFLGDIMTFDIANYQFLILGDILEHLSFSNASNLIYNIEKNSKKCIIAVPYLHEQGAYGGNVYETHLQPDLTPYVMSIRYPSLKVLFSNSSYGYYTNF